MTRYEAQFETALESVWSRMPPILVGEVRPGGRKPDARITILRDGRPFARISAYVGPNGPFTELIVWRKWVVLGWGGQAHFIAPATRRVVTFACADYFGHLYPFKDVLLIASGSELICIDQEAAERWRASGLGVDGVLVDDVADGVIAGQAGQDPPGGWEPFRLRLADGKRPAPRRKKPGKSGLIRASASKRN